MFHLFRKANEFRLVFQIMKLGVYIKKMMFDGLSLCLKKGNSSFAKHDFFFLMESNAPRRSSRCVFGVRILGPFAEASWY